MNEQDLEEAFRKIASELLSNQGEAKKEVRLTRAAVRERLNVDNSTLWRWDKIGYLKAIHIGRAVWYNESDVKNIEDGRSY